MKKLFLIPLLALAACASNVDSTPGPVAGLCPDGGVASNIIADEKAYAAALILYNVPAQAFKAANERKQLPLELKGEARQILIKMSDGLKVLRSALDAGNTSSFQCQFAALSRSSAEVKAIIGVQ